MARNIAKDLGRPADTDSEQTRANILKAAEECFGTAGYRATSNRDIAEKAGVTAATIYYYFKNKSDLFVSVHHDVQARLLDVAVKEVDQATSLTDGWIQMSQKISQISSKDPHISRFNSVVRMEAMRNPEISDVLYDKEWRDLYFRLATLGVETGELDKSRHREFRAVLSAVIFGLTQHATESSPEAHDICIKGMIELFRGDLIKPLKARKNKAKS